MKVERCELTASARGVTQPNHWTLHCLATFANVKTLNKFHALYKFKKTQLGFSFLKCLLNIKSKIAS